MSAHEPTPSKICVTIDKDNKQKFIKWLRGNIYEQITERLIRRAEEEL